MPSSYPLNAHEPPPKELKAIFKKYLRLKPSELDSDNGIIDFALPKLANGVEVVTKILSNELQPVLARFTGDINEPAPKDAIIYSHRNLPGLLMIPSLLPESAQRNLLNVLLHRDLSDAKHKTNVHMHYDISYPKATLTSKSGVSMTSPEANSSFFSYPPSSDVIFEPRDSNIHQPLSISRFLQKSLRWITLGGQYDWTKKAYPVEEPPAFPSDIRALLKGIFPEMEAQAAIVNLYSPGDTLSLHRDVSEMSANGLVSVSLGCDCLFVIGLGKDPTDSLILRLRSGDAVLMSCEARFAWHGVPKIIPNTCPSYLQSWPTESGQFEDWRDWMQNKRINLNVRQMYN